MKNTSFSTDSPTGPLSGLKVLELGQLIAGPFAAKTLADFGADVIKIEPPGMGDPLRKWRLLKDGTSVWWQVQSRNKRSLALDLKDPRAQDIVRQLAGDVDVLIENFKVGGLKKYGLDYEGLKAINPKLIYASIIGFSEKDERVAYDLILQAESGFMSMNGTSGSGPLRMPVAMIDTLAAHQLKEGILTALYERERSGKGCSVSLKQQVLLVLLPFHMFK